MSLDVIYSNTAEKQGYAGNSNRFIMYMQFEDEKPLDPKRLKFYDGLFVANVLSPSSA